MQTPQYLPRLLRKQTDARRKAEWKEKKDVLVWMFVDAKVAAKYRHHVVTGALAFFQGHVPQVRGQRSLGHH